MTPGEMAALIAGAGILMMTFGIFQIASQALLQNRLRVFVRRGPVILPVSVRRARKKESSVPFVEGLNRRLRQAHYSRRLQQQIIRAGLEMQASRFIVVQVIGAGLAFVIVRMLGDMLPDLQGLGSVVLAMPAAGIAWYVPLATLNYLEGSRLKKLEKQLPPTIDSMAGALQAGSSLPQAMEMASREVAAPIGKELGIVVREMAVGVPMHDAFANMLVRSRSLDLDMLVSAISIQHRGRRQPEPDLADDLTHDS